jgi:hypothetical protein
MTIAPSLTAAPNDFLTLHVGANATRFGTDAWSLGAQSAFSGRNPLGRFAVLTLDGSAGLSRLSGSSRSFFGHADIVPALEARVGAITVFGGARAAMGRVTEEVIPAGPPVLGGSGDAVVTARTGAGPLYGAAVSLAQGDAGTVRLGAREDRMSIEGASVIDRTATIAATGGVHALAASVGHRNAAGNNQIHASISVSIGIGNNAALELSGGRSPANHLLGTPGGEFAGAGLSLRFGSARDASLPKPSNARPRPAGTTRLSLRAPGAERVEVAGDFTEWKAVPATRSRNGVWYADLKIEPGQYRYAFRVNGKEWVVPDGATDVDDGFGGKSAWITVTGQSH